MSMASEQAPSSGGSFARLFVLLSGGILAAMVQLAILPSLTQMAAHFSDQGDGAFIAQLVTAVAAPAMAFGAPLIGWLAGVLGKRQVLLISALAFAASGVAGAFAPDLWTLIGSRVILGLASAGLGTMAMTFIADLYQGEQRDRMIGLYTAIGGAGSLVTLLVAGALVSSVGWRAPFGLYLVGLVVFLVALPSIREAKRSDTVLAAEGDGSMRNAWGLLGLMVLMSIAMYMVSIQGVFLLDHEGIKSPNTQAIIMDVMTVGSMSGSYLFGFLRPRLGFTTLYALVWALLGVGSAGFALASSVPLIAIFAAFSGFGAGLMVPTLQSAIINVVPPSASSRAMGLSIGCIFLGQLVNPFVVKPIREAIGLDQAFIWVGGVSLVAALLTMLWRARGGLRTAPSSS